MATIVYQESKMNPFASTRLLTQCLLMAQKPIREITAKTLIASQPCDGLGDIRCVGVDPQTDLEALPTNHPWLSEGKIVAKADEMFGKRGKRGLVCIADSYEQAQEWITEHRGTEIDIDGKTGQLNHFILEPCIEHDNEHYLAFTCEADCDVISYSAHGGVDVEEQTDITQIRVTLDSEPDVSPLPKELHTVAVHLFSLFKNLDLSYLEINPLTIVDGTVYLLDAVCRVDTCSAFRQRAAWGTQEIPEGFGVSLTPQEIAIQALDAKSGSSLKFVLLNPQGRIWTMVAGGGASIIYADDITSQVDASELANYGEWSGNPSTDEMEAYTTHILELMSNQTTPNALLIGGGIANFTDIAKTFAGVIKALQANTESLKDTRIYVRRAGPNDTKGLAMLQQACDDLGIPCVTYGADLPMTDIVSMATKDLQLTS